MDWERRWDGERWLDDRRDKPPFIGFWARPGGVLTLGVVISILGGIFGSLGFLSNETTGFWMTIVGASIGGTIIQAAVIAFGVDLGMRTARRRR